MGSAGCATVDLPETKVEQYKALIAERCVRNSYRSFNVVDESRKFKADAVHIGATEDMGSNWLRLATTMRKLRDSIYIHTPSETLICGERNWPGAERANLRLQGGTAYDAPIGEGPQSAPKTVARPFVLRRPDGDGPRRGVLSVSGRSSSRASLSVVFDDGERCDGASRLTTWSIDCPSGSLQGERLDFFADRLSAQMLSDGAILWIHGVAPTAERPVAAASHDRYAYTARFAFADGRADLEGRIFVFSNDDVTIRLLLSDASNCFGGVRDGRWRFDCPQIAATGDGYAIRNDQPTKMQGRTSDGVAVSFTVTPQAE